MADLDEAVAEAEPKRDAQTFDDELVALLRSPSLTVARKPEPTLLYDASDDQKRAALDRFTLPVTRPQTADEAEKDFDCFWKHFGGVDAGCELSPFMLDGWAYVHSRHTFVSKSVALMRRRNMVRQLWGERVRSRRTRPLPTLLVRRAHGGGRTRRRARTASSGGGSSGRSSDSDDDPEHDLAALGGAR